MRIVQIIDSLDVGGAERMAVNYANALSVRIEFSGLVATRKEGDLKRHIAKNVEYIFLDRKRIIDWTAVHRLKTFCSDNDVQYLQPHSSSYFIALLVKILHPRIQIIWHDHNGLSEFLSSQKWIPLKIASFFFKGIIAVNFQLTNWAMKALYCKHVLYLPNFTNPEKKSFSEAMLAGNPGKRILCLANLRDQKNHFLLLKVAQKLKKSHPDWSFHLVGKDFEDDYSKKISNLLIEMNLVETVFLYGSRNDTPAIIEISDIAILTSKSEGLPVALLEYGWYGKPVVVTDVGEIPMIIENGKNGFVVPSGDAELFHDALSTLIDNPNLRNNLGAVLQKTIMQNHSEAAVIAQYLEWIKKIK